MLIRSVLFHLPALQTRRDPTGSDFGQQPRLNGLLEPDFSRREAHGTDVHRLDSRPLKNPHPEQMSAIDVEFSELAFYLSPQPALECSCVLWKRKLAHGRNRITSDQLPNGLGCQFLHVAFGHS